MRVLVRQLLAVMLLAGCGALLVWMFLGRAADAGLVGNANVVGGIAGVAAFAATALAVWPRKPAAGTTEFPVAADRLPAAEAHLARETLAYWREQAKARRITTPAPAGVSWRWAGPDVAPPPSESAGSANAVALLSDRVVSQLRQDLYEELPVPGRIVILGGPGAGKTTAMLLLLIDVLSARVNARAGADEVPVGPVPAWVTLGGWVPETAGLLDYAASVVNRDYPGLAAHGGPDAASELLRSGRIALFLDGFDEMPDGVRGPALEAIDAAASGLRVVVTSRSDEYRSASRLHRLWSAAVIELQPVDLDHACEFLMFQQKGARRAAWERVTDHMRGEPGGVAAQTLRNPLALSLARDTYTHTDAHPAALLDHSTPEALLEHLLIRLLEISYPKADEHAHAVRWLSWIADNLHGQRDIRWWDIPSWIDEGIPGLVVVARIVVGLLSGLVYVLVLVYAGGLPGALVLSLMIGLYVGIVFGLGPAFGLAWRERFLALRGLSVRFRPLLRVALERQVLRKVGAVHQFRHAELQDLLTTSDSPQAESASAVTGK